MRHPLPVTFLLWATTGSALAQQLVPMDAPVSETTLTPMASAEPSAGQLVPMESHTLQSQPELTPMASTAPDSPVALEPMHPAVTLPAPVLVAMVTRSPTEVRPLVPMQLPVPDSDTTITPLRRSGNPEVMHGRTTPHLVGPVAPLDPLPSQLRVTPTSIKPLVLKKPANTQAAKPILAAGTTAPTTNIPQGLTSLNPLGLTDSALSPNPSIPTATRPDNQLIAVDITLNNINRPNVLEIYQDTTQTLWLPLTQLAQLLEMPLSVNAAAGVAQGWYQSPSNTLLLNIAGNSITIGTQTFPVGADVEKHDSDLYISSIALQKWFGVTSRLDYNELRLYLTTPFPLPGDLHASRMGTWDKLARARNATVMPSDTILPPYSNFSLPVLRLGANSTITKGADNSAALATGLTIQAENDLFGTNSNFALSFSQKPGGPNGFTGGSLLLQKESENADLLGPLKARYFGLGDITTNPIALSGISSHGRGARVSNLPAGTVTNPDQYILTGPAPINWDVEVYQNASLVAFSRIDASGTYRFTALPLRSGRNVFRIVLYGPNGEHDEREETIYLADNLAAPGEWQYDTAVFQPNHALIPGVPNQPSDSAVTAQTQFSTGLTRNWAATVGAFNTTGTAQMTDLDKPESKGVSAGLRGSMGGTYLTADAFAGGSGNALQASLRTPLTDNVDLRLSQNNNYGFDSTERDELTTTTAELAAPLRLGHSMLDSTYAYTRTTYQTQPDRHDFSQRTAVALGGLNATNQLDYITQNDTTQVTGNLETALHIKQTAWRTGLTYQPGSSDPLRQFYVNTQLPVGFNQTVNLTYTQQLTTPNTATLAGNMYWRTGPFSVGLQSQVASNGAVQAGLNLATALVPDGYHQTKWKLEEPNAVIGQGQAAVRVYADENGNGQYDPGEALLPNVVVYNRQRGNQQPTNSQGLATFTNLMPGTLTRLDIDLTSLPDIYLKPVSDTLNVKAHAGDNGILNYAVRIYGEISGQALTTSGRPIQNLTVTLRDMAGNKVDTTTTESDGFYTFGALSMGTYNLVTDTTSTTITLTAKSRIQTHNLTTNPSK